MSRITTNAVEALCTRHAKMAGGGISIGLRIHSDDVSQAIQNMEPNKRYAVAFVEIDDNEMAAPSQDGDAESPLPIASVSGKTRPSISPEKRLVQQAAMMCERADFRMFLEKTFMPLGNKINTSDDAAEIVRHLCEVESRKEIIVGTPAADRWDRLMGRFSAWEYGMVT